MKTSTFFTLFICFGQMIISHKSFSQVAKPMSVGINTDYPQATLHVHGTLRVDSLEYLNVGTLSSVMSDSVGNLFRVPYILPTEDSAKNVIVLPFDDIITAGDLVSIGDGKSAYSSVYSYTTFVSNETSDNVKYVAQGFRTTSSSKSIRAVQMTVPITSGATHHFNFYLRANVGGVPGSTNLASHAEIFVGTATVTSASLFVFDPPFSVMPNTDYFLVMQMYVNTNTSRAIRTVTNSIANGYLATSTNAGTSWATYPTRDVEMILFEIRSLPGKIYRSESVWAVESLRPDQTTALSTSGVAVLHNWYDRSHACIGTALESGTPGQFKKVSVGPVVEVNQVLIPGSNYFVGSLPGSVTTTIANPYFSVPVGLAIDVNKLYLVH